MRSDAFGSVWTVAFVPYTGEAPRRRKSPKSAECALSRAHITTGFAGISAPSFNLASFSIFGGGAQHAAKNR